MLIIILTTRFIKFDLNQLLNGYSSNIEYKFKSNHFHISLMDQNILLDLYSNNQYKLEHTLKQNEDLDDLNQFSNNYKEFAIDRYQCLIYFQNLYLMLSTF